ncbi:AAA family ATPase [Bacteroides sp. 519]|uniref:phosphatase domain-containing protein n=1 Tax=Bacteroides sp. 519 TaxID=2302937 RepID=UPI0013D0EAB2|nr:AAA family ATPase [Bacteroides sp. 519]NDV58419.1 polynucleotide kinase [Bacteroides sp. 519]
MKKNPQLLILVGAPGSGKSTFAKYFIRTEENWIRLSRDDFRTMHFTYSNLSVHEECLITDMIDASIHALLKKKSNVIIDATHCRADYLEHYINKFNHLADISFKIFEADAKVIAERCEKRQQETGKRISVNVQRHFLSDLKELKKTFDFSTRPKTEEKTSLLEQDKSLPKAIICDLDGTLALMDNRNPFDATHADKDELNEPVANVLKTFASQGYQILLVSGREDRFREPTVRFLEKHAITYHQLWMRPSKDYRKDSIIKREIFAAEINGKYYIDFILDDRNQVVDMWRKELKLTCFQVNYGEF